MTAAQVPAVTVVVPTKDRFDLLSRTLRSVLAQQDVAVEVVVVDDGGSDGTSERLRGADRRIGVVRHDRPRGVSQARNTGLSRVRTPWVAFVDDDDLWAPGKLAHQLEALAADPDCRWACSSAAAFHADGAIVDIQLPPATRDVSVALLRGNVVPGGGSGVLAATELVRDVGGFDPSLSVLADWDCWLRLAQRAPLARVALPDVGYRRHGTSMAHDAERSEAELQRLRSTYAELYDRAGVEVDRVVWDWYLHRVTYGAGQWRAGVRRSWRLLREHGQRRALLQPVKYALPAVGRQRASRRLATRTPEAHDYAVRWLASADAAGLSC